VIKGESADVGEELLPMFRESVGREDMVVDHVDLLQLRDDPLAGSREVPRREVRTECSVEQPDVVLRVEEVLHVGFRHNPGDIPDDDDFALTDVPLRSLGKHPLRIPALPIAIEQDRYNRERPHRGLGLDRPNPPIPLGETPDGDPSARPTWRTDLRVSARGVVVCGFGARHAPAFPARSKAT
jgi:hypothetical protein